MSLYQQGIGGVEDNRPLVVVNTAKAGDTFWTAVKWIGAGITIIVGYREIKSLYAKHLRGEEDEGEEGEGDE